MSTQWRPSVGGCLLALALWMQSLAWSLIVVSPAQSPQEGYGLWCALLSVPLGVCGYRLTRGGGDE